jgi:predicted ATPase
MEAYDERYMEAEIHRHRGELALLQGGDVDRAEAHFARAIAVSRNQKADSLELRATMSLARLWKQLGKGPEARQRLNDVYSRFEEGFDTPDLRDAEVMLQLLGGMEEAHGTAPVG